MTIRVDQVAGMDLHAADLHRSTGLDHMDVRVGDQDLPGEQVEANLRDLRHIADAARGDRTNAAERPMDGRLHVAPERADRLRVEILNHRDLRLIEAFILLVVCPHHLIVPGVRRIPCGNDARSGIADHRLILHADAQAQTGIGIACGFGAHAEAFDGVADGRGVKFAQRFQLCICQTFHFRSPLAVFWLNRPVQARPESHVCLSGPPCRR